MEFKTHDEIDKYYEKQNLDVKEYNKEFAEQRKMLRQAISNVKKTKFLGGLFYSPIEGFRQIKEEVNLEWNRLQKLRDKSELDNAFEGVDAQ